MKKRNAILSLLPGLLAAQGMVPFPTPGRVRMRRAGVGHCEVQLRQRLGRQLFAGGGDYAHRDVGRQ